MKAGWRALEAVPGVFDLAKVVPQNQAQVTGSGPVAIATDPGQWWYAAGFRLDPKALRRWPRDAALLIRVGTTVQSGRIGAIFVADDLARVLGTTDAKSVVDGDATLEIVVDPPPSSGWLILRNDAPSGNASRCEVRTIRTFPAARETARSASRLAEVMGSDSTTIDLAKLGTAVAQATESPEDDILNTLRRKWGAVTTSLLNRAEADLANTSDKELWSIWTRLTEEATTGDGHSVRGWYHDLYRDAFKGKRVLDVGCGLGIDGLTLARAGASVTFLDIVASNLEILERLCRIAHLEDVRFHYLRDLASIETLPDNFDVIWCQASMIHAPFSFARREAEALLSHLPVGGRWIELAYPRERWERDGRLPFREWGRITDGELTPWAEWYDLKRLRARLHPAEFDVVSHFNFHQDDFVWFDLTRRK
jgi:2-polyprenyl-3-methyl-5-hydroxy-6-metoxy-1,4-benzoquinol methylase